MINILRASIAAVLATIFLALSMNAADGASFNQIGSAQGDAANHCTFELVGQIVSGDSASVSERLSGIIAQIFNYPSPLPDQQIIVCLSSDGGDLLEGLRLARVFRENAVTTKVRAGERCISACALAFLGGQLNPRSSIGFFSSRYLHPTSVLAFHAPQLNLPEKVTEHSRIDVELAYSSALLSISAILRQADYLDISPRLMRQIVSNTERSLHFVTTIDDLAAYSINLYGYSAPFLDQESRWNGCYNSFMWTYYSDLDPADWPSFMMGLRPARVRPGGLIEYYPFDGSLFCEHSHVERGAGVYSRIVQSENESLREARIRTLYSLWARFPSGTQIADIPIGPYRDFFNGNQ